MKKLMKKVWQFCLFAGGALLILAFFAMRRGLPDEGTLLMVGVGAIPARIDWKSSSCFEGTNTEQKKEFRWCGDYLWIPDE